MKKYLTRENTPYLVRRCAIPAEASCPPDSLMLTWFHRQQPDLFFGRISKDAQPISIEMPLHWRLQNRGRVQRHFYFDSVADISWTRLSFCNKSQAISGQQPQFRSSIGLKVRLLFFRSTSSCTSMTTLLCSSKASETVQILGLFLVDI